MGKAERRRLNRKLRKHDGNGKRKNPDIAGIETYSKKVYSKLADMLPSEARQYRKQLASPHLGNKLLKPSNYWNPRGLKICCSSIK